MVNKDIGKEIAQNNLDKYFSFDSKIEFLKQKEFSYFNTELDSDCVKARLKKRLKFWETLGANKFILKTIKDGYTMPFISQPICKNMNNNKSAYANDSHS